MWQARYNEERDDGFNMACGFLVCMFLICLPFIAGIIVLTVSGINGISNYSQFEAEVCTTTGIEIETNRVVITAKFEIDNITTTGIIIIYCDCRGSEPPITPAHKCPLESDCELIASRYPIAEQFRCFWYPNALELSLYSNLIGSGIEMIIGAVILFVVCCCISGGCFCWRQKIKE